MTEEIRRVQGHENYTEAEIMRMIATAKNQYEYDSIIDRLYFFGKDRRRVDSGLDIKSARRLYDLEKSEAKLANLENI